jgi:hypothetical protein
LTEVNAGCGDLDECEHLVDAAGAKSTWRFMMAVCASGRTRHALAPKQKS